MADLISRSKVMEVLQRHDLWFMYQSPEVWSCLKKEIEAISTEHYTLYGYRLEHLAYVAALLQNKGVTEENLADILSDVRWIVDMVLEEWRERIESTMGQVKQEGAVNSADSD